VWVECYNEQDIDLTAHIWTSAMAVATPLAKVYGARLERPGDDPRTFAGQYVINYKNNTAEKTFE
jgi:hypothetical protein